MSPFLHEADPTDTAAADAARRKDLARGWPAWRAVVGFGVVSLTADMVYEGARSVIGPLLASLGGYRGPGRSDHRGGRRAGAGPRLLFGSWADRRGATGA
jgi:hypothetical protein